MRQLIINRLKTMAKAGCEFEPIGLFKKFKTIELALEVPAIKEIVDFCDVINSSRGREERKRHISLVGLESFERWLNQLSDNALLDFYFLSAR